MFFLGPRGLDGELVRLFQLSLLDLKLRQAFEVDAGRLVVLSQGAGIDFQGALEQRLGSREITGVFEQQCLVAKGLRGEPMVRTKGFLPNLERSLQKWLRRLVLAEVAVEYRKIIQSLPRLGVLRAVRLLANLECLLKERFRFGVRPGFLPGEGHVADCGCS